MKKTFSLEDGELNESKENIGKIQFSAKSKAAH